MMELVPLQLDLLERNPLGLEVVHEPVLVKEFDQIPTAWSLIPMLILCTLAHT